MKATDTNIERVIDLLGVHGFCSSGNTHINSFRTTSIGYPGGSIVTLGGRLRFTKGNCIVTVGKVTTCISIRPDNPETVDGRGRLLGRKVFTFTDWQQDNFRTKDYEGIKQRLQNLDLLEK